MIVLTSKTYFTNPQFSTIILVHVNLSNFDSRIHLIAYIYHIHLQNSEISLNEYKPTHIHVCVCTCI